MNVLLEAALIAGVACSLALDSAADDIDGMQSALAGIGDVDGDGITDLAVASRDRLAPRVWILGGSNGQVLAEFEGGDGFGATVGAAGDLDGDGIPDLVVGTRAPRPASSAQPHLSLRTTGPLLDVFSGRSRARLWTSTRGFQACAVGDLDGDRASEIAIVELPPRDTANVPRARLVVLSGRDGAFVRDVSPLMPSKTGNASTKSWVVLNRGVDRSASNGLATIDDLDGDGFAELAVGAPAESLVAFVSPKSGKTLRLVALEASRTQDCVAWSLASGDLDGDGRRELAIGTLHESVQLLFGTAIHGDDPLRGSMVWHGRARNTYLDALAASLALAPATSRSKGALYVGANESGAMPWGDDGYVWKLLQPVHGQPNRDAFVEIRSASSVGVDVSAPGDLDRDGVIDVVIQDQARRDGASAPRSQTVSALSGATNATLWCVDVSELRETSAVPVKR